MADGEIYMRLNEILEKYIRLDQQEQDIKNSVSMVRLNISNILPSGFHPKRRPGEKRYLLPVEKPHARSYPKLINDKGEFILNLIFEPLRLNITKCEIEQLLNWSNVCYNSVTVIKRENKSMAFVTVKSLFDSLSFQIQGRESKYLLRNSFRPRVRPAHRQEKSKNTQLKIDRPSKMDTLSTIPEPAFNKIIMDLPFKDQFSLMLTSKFMVEKVFLSRKNLIVTSNNDNTQPIIPSYVFLFYLSPFGTDPIFRFNKILLSDPNQCQKINAAMTSLLIPKFQKCYLLTELDLSGITISSMAIVDLKNCVNLTSLKIGATTGSCDHQIDNFFRNSLIKSSLHTFGIYNNIYFSGASLANNIDLNIKNLILVYCLKLRLHDVQQFMSQSNTLDVLRIERCSHVDYFHCFTVLFENLQKSKLTTIELINSSVHAHHHFIFQCDNWAKPAINLKKLSIVGFETIYPNVIEIIIKNSPCLETLNIIDFNFQKYNIEFSAAKNLRNISLTNITNINDNFWKTEFHSLETICFRLKKMSCRNIALFIEANAKSLVDVDLLENSLYGLAILSDMETKENEYIWKNPINVIVVEKFIYKLKKSRSDSCKTVTPLNPLIKFINKKSLYEELKLAPKPIEKYKRHF